MSSLTNTFDQKLRTLNNSSPLDDGSIPYADECQEEHEHEQEEGKSSASSPSACGERGERGECGERVSPGARAHELKAAWLARDHRHSSSSSADEPEARAWPRQRRPRDDADDSEKENCIVTKKPTHNETRNDDDKDVDTRSQTSSGDTLPDNDKSIERVLYPVYGARTASDCAKRNSAALDQEPAALRENKDIDGAKLKRSESLNRDSDKNEARVLRSESLNCRAERLQRSESLNKNEKLTKVEKGEWNVVRRREGGAWRSTKLKRKNGMPERGIKRRHTVGGTKDFDKDEWSARHTRTSSPDLTSASVWPSPLVPPPRPPLESHV